MISRFIILLLWLAILNYSCSNSKTNQLNEKSLLNIEEIDRIEIKKNPFETTREEPVVKKLKPSQYVEFILLWNHSKLLGPCKSGIQYWLTAFLKDSTRRTYTANGNIMKENSDLCYDLSDEYFLDNIFNNAIPLAIETNNILELIQGSWIHTQDSLSTLTIHEKNWTFNYSETQTDLQDSYQISIVNEEDSTGTKISSQIILTNPNDTMHFEIMDLTETNFQMIHFPTGKIHLYKKLK